MVYQWKRGFSAPGANVQRVGEVLEEIRQEHGALPATAIVERAADRRSALHPLFEWDDRRAAHEQRLEVARKLVTKIVVVVDDDSRQESRTVQAFLARASVAPATPPRAKRVHGPRRVSVPAAAPANVEHAWEQLLSWRDRYQRVPEFAGIIAAIDRARAAASAVA